MTRRLQLKTCLRAGRLFFKKIEGPEMYSGPVLRPLGRLLLCGLVGLVEELESLNVEMVEVV